MVIINANEYTAKQINQFNFNKIKVRPIKVKKFKKPLAKDMLNKFSIIFISLIKDVNISPVLCSFQKV